MEEEGEAPFGQQIEQIFEEEDEPQYEVPRFRAVNECYFSRTRRKRRVKERRSM